MWDCPKCREEVEDAFEACWNCGTSRDGTEDPTFRRAEEVGAFAAGRTPWEAPAARAGPCPAATDEVTSAAPAPAEVRPPTTWPEVPPAVRFEEGLRQLVPWTPVTTTLVVLNVVVFLIMALRYGRCLEFNTHILMGWGAAYAPKALDGQWWRLLTCTFLHSGVLHLFGNVWFLLMAGRLVERLLGRAEFLLVYLFAGVGGAVAGMAWFPSTVMIGASGAVFGVYGALLGCYLRGR